MARHTAAESADGAEGSGGTGAPQAVTSLVLDSRLSTLDSRLFGSRGLGSGDKRPNLGVILDAVRLDSGGDVDAPRPDLAYG